MTGVTKTAGDVGLVSVLEAAEALLRDFLYEYHGFDDPAQFPVLLGLRAAIDEAPHLAEALSGALYALDESADGFGPSSKTAATNVRAALRRWWGRVP
jgi:hypothetical protein